MEVPESIVVNNTGPILKECPACGYSRPGMSFAKPIYGPDIVTEGGIVHRDMVGSRCLKCDRWFDLIILCDEKG